MYDEYSISLVDLAGTERQSRSEVTGKTLEESCKINLSLFNLSKCFDVMKNNVNSINKKNIPYRDSKLTMILQENFVTDNSIAMITNINPCIDDFEETLRILKFANLSSKIVTQKSRILNFNSNNKSKNDQYLLNGHLNPIYNSNPNNNLNYSNILNQNNILSEFNENENLKSKMNLFNFCDNEENTKNNINLNGKNFFRIFY